jgi:hypothetical protein
MCSVAHHLDRAYELIEHPGVTLVVAEYLDVMDCVRVLRELQLVVAH